MQTDLLLPRQWSVTAPACCLTGADLPHGQQNSSGDACKAILAGSLACCIYVILAVRSVWLTLTAVWLTACFMCMLFWPSKAVLAATRHALPTGTTVRLAACFLCMAWQSGLVVAGTSHALLTGAAVWLALPI